MDERIMYGIKRSDPAWCRCGGVRSGRYPWGESDRITFADKNLIRNDMIMIRMNDEAKVKFIYNDLDNDIHVRTTIRLNGSMGVGLDDLRNTAVERLAVDYDKIMIRRVFHMDYEQLNNLVSKINDAGGQMHLVCCDDKPNEVSIQIPVGMLNRLRIDDGSIDEMAYFRSTGIPSIHDIQTFNDRATVVTFYDGTQTKCVAHVDEEGNTDFDLYTGIAFCLFKRMLGQDGHKKFNTLMRKAMQVVEDQENREKEIQEYKEEVKRREEKKRLKAQKRKVKKLKKQADALAEAIRRAGCCAPEYYVPEPNIKLNRNALAGKILLARRKAMIQKAKDEPLPKTCAKCRFQIQSTKKCLLLPSKDQSCPVTFYRELLEEAGDDVFKTGRRCLCPLEDVESEEEVNTNGNPV